ncbi:NAD(P)/FAD-dependent oxidoreductase [Microbacterium sp. SS28]|uniref:protoporphyrinogen/coproporphyrinogen oxidase n=1 Tax=Microbacterium sp. SS28 TaxID=2919948 RepID=UPI001FAA778C|nr:FAD-dependent oxidoreductase [Microbacterium sp. SS28]
MTEPADDNELDAIAAAAQEQHIVVIGGGIAGLVAALECAKVGLRVTVLEAADRLGGTMSAVEVGGLELDAAVEGFSTRGGAVHALAVELGLGADLVPAADAAVWITGLPSGAAPLPDATVAGIPANAWDENVRRIIGWNGAWRAFLDRMRPPLTIGKQRSLGTLVRSRMGDAVLDRLVAPVSLGVYGTHPDDVDVEAVAPGLSTALTRTGSLSGAVADLLVDRSATIALESIRGGMRRLVDAAETRLVELGAEIRLGVRVQGLERQEDGRWQVAVDGDAALDPAAHVVVATPEGEARRLLAPVAPALDAPLAPHHPIEVVTLVVHEPALDAAPRGAAVYPIAGTAKASAVTDSTVRWPSVAALVEPGVHVLRVSFGTAGVPAATAALDDAAAAQLARDEASALLGVPLADVRGAARVRFEPPRPASTLGHAEAAHAVRGAVEAVGGLSLVGAWLAGSGLAQIVPDAVEVADALRRTALWSSPQP